MISSRAVILNDMTESAAADDHSPLHASSRRPGRPRIWVDDAERARAYRARRALEHADPDRLRKERRALERRVARLRDALEKERRLRELGELRVARLSDALDRERRGRERAEGNVARLTTTLEELWTRSFATNAPTTAVPHLIAGPESTGEWPTGGNGGARRRAARARRQKPT